MDNVTLNGHSYQLPTRTLAVVEQIESLMQTEMQFEKRQIRAVDCLTAEYGFILSIFGEEKSTEILGADNIREVDVNEVSIAVIKILTAYNEKVEKAKLEKQMQVLSDPKIKQALDLMKSSNKFSFPKE